MMLKKGDCVGIVGCSNGQKLERKGQIEQLLTVLQGMGLKPVCSSYIYEQESLFSGIGKERADALMEMYCDDRIKAIFDVSGGDVANEILVHLDFGCIREKKKPYFGYSDLTTVINSIYSRTGGSAYLYSIQNLLGKHGESQQKRFYRSLFSRENDLFDVSWKFLSGNSMKGVVIGGNIRCFLKLAGTQFMPDFTGKILFLEAYGGHDGLIASLLAQLDCIGAFKKIKGILLGTFTYMEKHAIQPSAPELVLRATKAENIPVAITRDIGHSSNSKCLKIGTEIELIQK